jgi:glycyl-tRNA synthetase beta chain
MPDLLIELFSEEIPARMQGKAAEDLRRLVTDGLVEAGLTYGDAQGFATPRRLALAVHGLSAESPTTREERRGPKVGAPDKAVEGFCRGAGVHRDALVERDEKKGRFYFATVVTPGRPAADIVAEVVERTVRGFPWPKSMRWGAGSLRWVRPLSRILCILTDDAGEASVVPLEIDGIRADRLTEGHRVMGDGPFAVSSFEDYEAKLKRAHVVLSAQERAATIRHDAANQAFAKGLEVVEDDALLREVAGLVEWPVVLTGAIEERFLDLPPEVLQTSMREHQKFFSLRNPNTERIEGFVTVANVAAPDDGARILSGNRKVLAARLSDAAFFWENDLRVAKAGMTPWLEALENVTFQNLLGSQAQRIRRIADLAREIAPLVGADPALAVQAAQVVKADLSSEMVYEFPELQGLMGRYYAEAAGLPAEVAAACADHYAPLGPSDAVPTAPVSIAVAMADKIDTLTGFWAIAEKPTGSKDPFALRRASLGVIRLVLENDLHLRLDRHIDAQLLRHKVSLKRDGLGDDEIDTLEELLDEIADKGVFGAAWAALRDRRDAVAVEKVVEQLPDLSEDLLGFFHDRLKVHLRGEGVPHDVIDASLAMAGNDDLLLLVKRAKALAAVLETDDGENLVQGFRRANNILSQAEEADGVEYSYGADPAFAETEEERALFAALETAEARIGPAMKSEKFAEAMAAMAALRAPIDAFFEAVQVNTDNQIVRRNRLNLLAMIRNVCLQVADLSRIEG